MGHENDQVEVLPAPSRARRSLLGGLGCLLLVFLICGGGGAWIWFQFAKPSYDYMIENEDLATANPAVIEALGDPVSISGEHEENVNGAERISRIPVKGANGSGVVVIVSETQADGTFLRKSAILEFDGEEIDLLEDDGMTIEIEGL